MVEIIKAFFMGKNNAPKTTRATRATITSTRMVVDEPGRKRIEEEHRRRQAVADAKIQKRKQALLEEQRRKGNGLKLVRTNHCQRRDGIFKFQRDYIDCARFSVNERYSMINRARALGKKGKVLPEVEKAYFEKFGKKK